MNLATNMNLWGLVVQSSVLVQAILLFLLLVSVASWVVIFAKRRLMKVTMAEIEWFEDRFWSGGNFKDIYDDIHQYDDEPESMPALFKAGYEELKRQLDQEDVTGTEVVPSVQRAMRVALSRETERLESGLSYLATVGSISPYVGLFGTVWGIMNAFIGLGNVQQASLAMVAPGIAEALIATAMGLFAAIPAVVAYNFFINRLEVIENRFDTFMEEMSGIVERGVIAAKPSARTPGKANPPEPMHTAPEL
jgi:biopolymer transport protein TolQ